MKVIVNATNDVAEVEYRIGVLGTPYYQERGTGHIYKADEIRPMPEQAPIENGKESADVLFEKDLNTKIGHWLDHLDDEYGFCTHNYTIEDIKRTARFFAIWGTKWLIQKTNEIG